MSVSQNAGGALWTDRADQSGAASLSRVTLQKATNGDWIASTVQTPQGALYDVGEGYTVFDITTEYVFVANGSGDYTLVAGGTPSAVLADDGAGGLMFSTDLTKRVARVLADSVGDLYPIRLDAVPLDLVQLGDTISPIAPL